MFTGASNLAEGVDKTFIFIFSIAIIFIVGISVFMIYTVIHFSRKKGKKPLQFSGSIKLEILWTLIPLILVMLMFYYGEKGFAPMRKVPADALQITAIGRMWEWEFDYGNGMKSRELVLPVNKPVRIGLKSEDVNHSLFIPAFRVKEDVIPGYDNYLWFIPTHIGEYEILCTEYCGLLHSSMLSKAKILEQADYDKWFADFKSVAVVAESDGYLLIRNTGCIACHSLDGTKLVGPSFKDLYSTQRIVLAGNNQTTVMATDEYIIKSIYDPDSEVVKGFNKGLMRSYKDILKENEIKIIIDYLKTLSEKK
jgi:cytochrome c oxidase subunit II